MQTRPTCHVFLADDPASKELLTVYCKSPEYDKDAAFEMVSDFVKRQNESAAYEVYYMGVIDFAECDQVIIDRSGDYFVIETPIWLTRGAYAG